MAHLVIGAPKATISAWRMAETESVETSDLRRFYRI